ncbi:hypothetical protein CANTEDRAFT_135151 [Yamadazyma tenuis ATCC 10573]|uniref:Mitochondrial escape protein 2 n=1 Tax=Candida tenuis (strain ATCC 10573 / BCRC 21748 / CBS 615 / JCM 9827 / NBRC 10315 / NRRL Y-1498 / VKM Y-70) TaxID=590646 RepID=G3B5X1_CANTC|nr:uncharacterized protein CANTEDRAFT_135151 [Yamadazyma tenuis ATCC 10573]EGV63325.1 hypothetical protein CANTEDRAFT_135151 [Yamadazyma tenuis ATCC 10573]
MFKLVNKPRLWGQLRFLSNRKAQISMFRDVRHFPAFQKSLRNRMYHTDIERIKKETDLNDTDVSASATGVVDIDKTKEVLLYFDHIYDRGVSSFKFKQYLNLLIPDKDIDTLKKEVWEMANKEDNPLPESTSIMDFIPLRRDSGAFVKFSVPEGYSPKEVIAKICTNVSNSENDANNFKKLYMRLTRNNPTTFQVKGTPWIEDLRRFPSSKLKVKFEGPSLTEEELYILFRRYGTIIDINPASSSNPIALIQFKRLRSSICAKNCITGLSLDGGKTTLHLQYVPIERVNYITDFISNHQRIAVPILLALLATVAVLIFDPIRQFFIEEKIQHRLSLSYYRDSRYLKLFTRPLVTIQSWFFTGYDYIGESLDSKCHQDTIANESDLDNEENLDSNNLWHERSDKIKQLKLWILENVSTFIIVRGPKGSGKREMVVQDTLLSDAQLKQKVLYLDCDEIIKARSDTKLVESIASQVGYYPVFSWLSSISQFIDLGVQSVTGQKSGLSESKETQVKNIFSLTTQALRSTALREYGEYERQVSARKRRQEHRKRSNPGLEIKLDDVMKPDEYLQQRPEAKPVIVINKFASKSRNSSNDFIYKMMSDWAATLVQSNLAHVIFITNDVGSISVLNSSLPNQVFKTITLNDASETSSYYYVMNKLKDLRYEKFNSDIIKETLKPLGGRMLDLQAFIRRIRSGETPQQSLTEMVSQAAEQITTFFLYNNTKPGDEDFKNWDPLQVWELIKLLSSKDIIKYNELTKSPLFKAGNNTMEVLSALEKNDLLTLRRENGVLNEIRTGRPIFKAAFKTLIDDKDIFASLEIGHYNNLAKLETAKIKDYEEELSKFHFKEYKLDNRLKYLVDKIEESNTKVNQYEQTADDIKKGVSNHSTSFLGIF